MSRESARWNADELHVWLEDKLRSEDREDLANVLKECRVPFEITCLCCHDKMMVNTGCNKRWCPVCGPKVTARRYARIAPIANRMQWPLSVMFTVANTQEIAGCVNMLRTEFKEFRRTKFWKSTVAGGFVGFEMTHKGKGCHIHLHALIDCEWLAVSTPKITRRHTPAEKDRLCELAQAELSAVWAAYLGQPKAVVWVRRANRDALAETIKYPFKPSDFKKLRCSISEIIDEIDAGRLIATFGNCHGSAKKFLGRDEPIARVAQCKVCHGKSSLVPGEVVQQWARGCGQPGAKAIAAMEWEYFPETGLVPIGKWERLPSGQVAQRDDDFIPW